MYTTQDLKTLAVKDIEKELAQARTELFEHRMNIRLGKETTSHKIRSLRKYTARLATIKTQKETAAPTSK